MHRHIGDERRGRDIARRFAAEQRGAEFGTRDLDDVKALFGERNADDLELLAAAGGRQREVAAFAARSEEHTSELQSLMRTSYAVFCLHKKNRSRTPRPRIKRN